MNYSLKGYKLAISVEEPLFSYLERLKTILECTGIISGIIGFIWTTHPLISLAFTLLGLMTITELQVIELPVSQAKATTPAPSIKREEKDG